MAYSDFLTQTASILRRAVRRGGMPTPEAPTEPVRSGLPCLVRPLRAEAVARQGRDFSQGWARIYFADDPGVTNDHLIVVAGVTYEVKGEVDANSLGRVFAVDCTQTRS